MPENPFDLSGKVALVTGANSGLGLGFAHGLARAGADLVIWGRREERNEQAAAELRAHGGRVLAQRVDVTDERAVAAATTAAREQLGWLDCAVVNAGFNSGPFPFDSLPTDRYHELLEVNLHGAVYTLRAVTAQMLERVRAGGPGGSLVACGSLTAVAGVPGIAHYAAAKGALTAVTRSIAVEYGRYGIRANAILPGRIASELAGNGGDDAARVSAIPIPRLGTPADLEGIVVYLASDASAYHTGDLIAIDGGLSVALPGAA